MHTTRQTRSRPPAPGFRPLSRMLATGAAASVCLLACVSAASAHAFLATAAPRVGSTIRTPPAEVVLTFTQGVEPAFSKMQVTNAGGIHEETGAAHTSGTDPTKLAVPIGKLPPGTYRVTWHVTSVDTHQTQGTFPFTVAP